MSTTKYNNYDLSLARQEYYDAQRNYLNVHSNLCCHTSICSSIVFNSVLLILPVVIIIFLLSDAIHYFKGNNSGTRAESLTIISTTGSYIEVIFEFLAFFLPRLRKYFEKRNQEIPSNEELASTAEVPVLLSNKIDLYTNATPDDIEDMKKKIHTIQVETQSEIVEKNIEQQNFWDDCCCGNRCRTDQGLFIFISLGTVFAFISSLLGTEEIKKGFSDATKGSLTFYQLGFSIASGFFFIFAFCNNMCIKIPDEEVVNEMADKESQFGKAMIELIGSKK